VEEYERRKEAQMRGEERRRGWMVEVVQKLPLEAHR